MIAQLLTQAQQLGIELAVREGKVQIRGSDIPSDFRELLRQHKPAILEALAAERERSVTISGEVYPYSLWNGSRIAQDSLAFDTETSVVNLKQEVPTLVLASASSDTGAHASISPDQLATFVQCHRALHWVTFNGAFDFWAVEEYLRRHNEEQARLAWWAIAAEGRLHDAMFLDMLIRLAVDDSFPYRRDLAEVANESAGMVLDKGNPYRSRFGEILGKNLATVDRGFLDYAVTDAIATLRIWTALTKKAQSLMAAFDGKEIRADAVEKFGLLTESLQLRKAIALAQITRNGIHVDQEMARRQEAELRGRLGDLIRQVEEACPGLYKRSAGQLVLTAKTKVPSKNDDVLRTKLGEIEKDFQKDKVHFFVPRTQKQKISAKREDWDDYADGHPFLDAWLKVEEIAKLALFYQQPDAVAHPTYTSMVRTGRTSSSGPNIQQIPKKGPFREIFVPSPGHLFLAVDYSFIELVTFAATAYQWYGYSALGDVIKCGADPHQHTAAMMLGIPLEEFQSWKISKRDEYDAARQASKACNFGVPGSLGAERLAAIAKHSYGLNISVEEAKTKRQSLLDIYPELKEYLREDVPSILARNLRTSPDKVSQALQLFPNGDLPHISTIRKTLSTSAPKRKDGGLMSSWLQRSIFNAISRVNRNPDFQEALQAHKPSEHLASGICRSNVATITGRIRGGVRYSQARNTPFQGLAIDGAGLAIFELIRQGFRVVAFIHDEVLVEVPDEGGHVSVSVVERVEQILKDQMTSVLAGDLPIKCEPALSTCWSKRAELLKERDKVLPWTPPAPEAKGEVAIVSETYGKPAPALIPMPSDIDSATIAQEGRSDPLPVSPESSSRCGSESECSAFGVGVLGSKAGAVLITGALANGAAVPAPTPQLPPEPPAAENRNSRPSKTCPPPFKYWGGKTRIVDKILELMPPHAMYVEPFCGSAQVFFKRNPLDKRWEPPGPYDPDYRGGVSEVLNDLDGRVINFFRAVRNPETYQRLYERLHWTLVSRAEWESTLVHEYGKDPIADAVAFFTGCRQSRDGAMKNFAGCTKERTRRGMNDLASAWWTGVEGLADVRDRLSRVLLENRPAMQVIKQYDGPRTLIYTDPPYVQATRVAKDVYRYEMSLEDHSELL
jgi:DNA adenine methylase